MIPWGFHVGTDWAYDWGHYLRATGGQWTWVQRVLAWNPCNNIGVLYDYDT